MPSSPTAISAHRPPRGRRARRTAAKGHPTVVLAVVLITQLMVVLDVTIVNVALPHIQHSLGFSPANLSWVLNAYTLAFGGLLLLGARSGDLLGRRRTFVGGVALFTAASLAGGLAGSAGELLAARAAQGVGAAFAAPAALALLTSMFPEGRERTRAIGYYSAVSVGGGAVGLLAGGMLTAWLSWRWVLFVNVLIGAVLVVLALRVVAETPRVRGRFDLAGALTSTLGMVAVVFGFIHAATASWTAPATLGSFAAAAVLLAVFVGTELHAPSPVIPLRLFGDTGRSAAYVARLLVVAAMSGIFFFLTQFLQDVLGYGPLTTGVAFLPITIALFVASQASARVLVERFGSGRVMLVGIALSTTAPLWLSQLSEHSGYLSVLGPLLAFGVGNGLSFVPLTAAGLAGVTPSDAGAASGLTNVMQQVGGSVGLAVLVTVYGAAARDVVAQSGGAGSAEAAEVAHQAFVAGADRAFGVAALFLLAALVLIGTTGRRRATVTATVPRPAVAVED